MIVLLVYVTCAVFVGLSVYLRYCYAGRLLAKIPGPPALPLFGNVLSVWKSPEQIFKDLRAWHKKYGRLWKLDGAVLSTVHLYHPEDVERILATNGYHHKYLPYTYLHGWLGSGLLVSNGDKWHQRRKMLTPAFHFNILNKFFRTFCEHTQDLLYTMEDVMDKEKTDLIPLISKTTLRIMCETSMGTKTHKDTSDVDNYLKAIHRMGKCLAERITKPWYIIKPLYTLSPLASKEKSILLDLHNFTKQMIQERRDCKKVYNAIELCNDDGDGKKIRPAMLDLLLDEEEKGTIDDAGIREEVDTFLFEGHDTTATAITFMIMRIANEPEIQNLIYKELKDIFGDSQRQPALEDLSRMKYLECCIKESLRLYPSVPFLARYITEEIQLAGYTIPKNTHCSIHVYDIHRNLNVFPDPEKFIPERFLQNNLEKRHPYSYIPFSAGPRNCIGQKFAIMELKTLVSGVLRKYWIEPVTRPEDLVFTADIVLRTNHPIYVRFGRRKL